MRSLTEWRLASFNEAGAGCPGILEQLWEEWCLSDFKRRFNEAGAGCPGILLTIHK